MLTREGQARVSVQTKKDNSRLVLRIEMQDGEQEVTRARVQEHRLAQDPGAQVVPSSSMAVAPSERTPSEDGRRRRPSVQGGHGVNKRVGFGTGDPKATRPIVWNPGNQTSVGIGMNNAHHCSTSNGMTGAPFFFR